MGPASGVPVTKAPAYERRIPRASKSPQKVHIPSQRLPCNSSFLVMIYLLLRDYNRLPKTELDLSFWVNSYGASNYV